MTRLPDYLDDPSGRLILIFYFHLDQEVDRWYTVASQHRYGVVEGGWLPLCLLNSLMVHVYNIYEVTFGISS